MSETSSDDIVPIDLSVPPISDDERDLVNDFLSDHLPGYVLDDRQDASPQARVYRIQVRDISPSLSDLLARHESIEAGFSNDPDDPRLTQSNFGPDDDLQFYAVRSADLSDDQMRQVAIVSLELGVVVGVA